MKNSISETLRSVSSFASPTADNCMTINPSTVTVGSKTLTVLTVMVRNTQSGERLYSLHMRINLAHLGFPDTGETDWTEDAVARDPSKKQFIVGLTDWAKKLQFGVNKAIDWKKPVDAFEGVPPINELLTTLTEISKPPRQFGSPIEKGLSSPSAPTEQPKRPE